MFDQISGTVVLICGQNKVATGSKEKEKFQTMILPNLGRLAKLVFQVFKQWNDGMESGILSSEDIGYLKKSIHKKKTTILPTDKIFVLQVRKIIFVTEKRIQELRNLGIPLLSEAVTCEAIYYDPTDSSFKASLITWALPYAQPYIYTNNPT
ncbi:unnamed protein product [Lactuca virosa]|uniref:Uncharacterized protein n=1 Tax=Lactuca virosa TaxID=75947 RepID=A0AAU9PGT3_9ASTR|nr:unnamed protein product [Lactuca virosa]